MKHNNRCTKCQRFTEVDSTMCARCFAIKPLFKREEKRITWWKIAAVTLGCMAGGALLSWGIVELIVTLNLLHN